MTKKLFEILPENVDFTMYGDNKISVQSLQIDSRKIQKGDIYAAFVGTQSDGHDFIESAIDRGAICVVCERMPEDKKDITYILTSDARGFVGQMLSKYYDNPSDKMTFVGVTGTNGKTSVATLLFQLFSELGFTCGLISTVQNRIGDEVLPSEYTTPDIVSLYELLHKMDMSNCSHIFMEVSSHALHQKRVSGLKYKCAIFTNITHDHLDYHGDMKNYIASKKLLFDHLDKESFALVNSDDRNGKVMVQNCQAHKRTFGLHSMSDFKAKVIESSLMGLHLKINDFETHFRMVGEFNAYNLLAVFGVTALLGINHEETLKVLSGLEGAEGRFEVVRGNGSNKTGIVDYAHTPDALENVLKTLQKVKKPNSHIISVVGCGGDRDKEKRPIMAKIACSYSEKVVITSDNPRTEDPEKILNEMEQGINQEDQNKVLRVSDRYQAIKSAVMLAGNNDIILVAGKGHEKYQEIKGMKIPFDDKKILEELLK